MKALLVYSREIHYIVRRQQHFDGAGWVVKKTCTVITRLGEALMRDYHTQKYSPGHSQVRDIKRHVWTAAWIAGKCYRMTK